MSRRFTRGKGRHSDFGWIVFRDAMQSDPADMPDVVWVDGVLFVVEP